jgi:hypothetical protein
MECDEAYPGLRALKKPYTYDSLNRRVLRSSKIFLSPDHSELTIIRIDRVLLRLYRCLSSLFFLTSVVRVWISKLCVLTIAVCMPSSTLRIYHIEASASYHFVSIVSFR